MVSIQVSFTVTFSVLRTATHKAMHAAIRCTLPAIKEQPNVVMQVNVLILGADNRAMTNARRPINGRHLDVITRFREPRGAEEEWDCVPSLTPRVE